MLSAINVDRSKLITFCINRSIIANANIACYPGLLFISYIIVVFLFIQKGIKWLTMFLYAWSFYDRMDPDPLPGLVSKVNELLNKGVRDFESYLLTTIFDFLSWLYQNVKESTIIPKVPTVKFHLIFFIFSLWSWVHVCFSWNDSCLMTKSVLLEWILSFFFTFLLSFHIWEPWMFSIL